MYKGFKVIPVIPAGRQKTMSILFKYFLKNADIIDEVWLLENTVDKSDLEYINLTAKNPLFKIKKLPSGYIFNTTRVQLNTGAFYEYMTDPKAIYIRFDDDIIYVDDKYFKNILDFRIKNPDYFLVFGNIWNNAIISYIHQQLGNIGTEHGIVDSPYCMDMVGWGNPHFAEYIHRLLLEKINNNEVKDLFFDKFELTNGTRFSISNFAFFGKDFKKFGGKLDYQDTKGYQDEEIWLCTTYPKRGNKTNVICGNALVSHYTFSPYQKPHIANTDILEQYKQIAEDKLSQDYYKFLNKKI